MVVVDAGMMTGRPGIFAGGDMAPGDRTVTAAVGHGKKAARHIDAWLGGQASRRSKASHSGFRPAQSADLCRRAARSAKRTARGGDVSNDGFAEITPA